MKKSFNLSICVVCMNRLHQLQETFLKNITDNKNYGNIEFTLLDYNSQDGLSDWAIENLSEFINLGIVNYYKTFDPDLFSHSHAKNMALRLGKGDILCHVNADHFTGSNFAQFVNDSFQKDLGIVLTHIPDKPYKYDWTHSRSDLWGKVCVMKDDFLKIGGFDERFTSYGWEDVDFINRISNTSVQKIIIYDPEFLKFIEHGEDERSGGESTKIKFQSIYIAYRAPWESELIFFLDSNIVETGVIIDLTTIGSDNLDFAYGEREIFVECKVEGGQLKKGKWKINPVNEFISVATKEGVRLFYRSEYCSKEVLLDSCSQEMYFKVTDDETYSALTKFFSRYISQSVLLENIVNRRLKVNSNGFGKGIVYKNFNYHLPIIL